VKKVNAPKVVTNENPTIKEETQETPAETAQEQTKKEEQPVRKKPVHTNQKTSTTNSQKGR